MDIQRICQLDNTNSFFLFGARGTGKTTLLKTLPFLKDAIYIDLLNSDTEEKYSLRPQLLLEQARALPEGTWIIIDEIQKLPKLLDHVQITIEEKKIFFGLTGSSSRKLKRGGANLLAGRAFNFSLYPLTLAELADHFVLNEALQWGTLPKLYSLSTSTEKIRFLKSYSQTYLKEEILVEQLIRNLDPFRLFLPIAAQMNTQIVNYSNIAKDTGVDYKTIQNYYQILVETNLGFFLEPYNRSVRKVQKASPKFYFFDTGVKRALQRKLTLDIEESTSEYGELFESWFINECLRLNQYKELDYEFFYLRTKDDVEVDLIIDRPGKELMVIEIKSSRNIDERHIKNLKHFESDFPGAIFICASRVEEKRVIGNTLVLPYTDALNAIF